MANLTPASMIIILVICIIVALVIGFFIGRRAGGGSATAIKEERRKHDEYKSEVREHFKETSAIMTRMVEDYRAIYLHVSEGAEKLADLGSEKTITAPPPPKQLENGETVTTAQAGQVKNTQTGSASSKIPASTKKGGSSPAATANGKPADKAPSATTSTEVTRDKNKAAPAKADPAPKPGAEHKKDSSTPASGKTPAAGPKHEKSTQGPSQNKQKRPSDTAPAAANASKKPEQKSNSPEVRHIPIGSHKKR